MDMAAPWGAAGGGGAAGAAACRRSARTRRSMARNPRTLLRIVTFACLSRSSTGLATSRTKWLWQSRCGMPGNSVAMGEAAGVTAALAATTKRLPHEVPWSEAEAKLKALGQRV